MAMAVEDVGLGARYRIGYFAPFTFPEGCAGSRRVLGIARILVACGYSVDVYCHSAEGEPSQELIEPGICVKRVEGLIKKGNLVAKIRWALTSGSRSCKAIASSQQLAGVFIYAGYVPVIVRMSWELRGSGVPVVFDAVEWYTPKRPLAWLISPYHWSTELAMRVLIPRLDGVLCISSYLFCYYRRRCVESVQIPPTLKVSLVGRGDAGPRDSLKLVYAGSASYDDLSIVIEAVREVNKRGLRTSLVLAGHPRLDAASARGPGDEEESFVSYVGRLGHRATMQLVANSHFSLIVRRSSRAVNAGFPTKLVESLAVGTPVIGNVTSDLGQYVIDGETGFVIGELTGASFVEALMRAHRTTEHDYDMLSRSCRQTAERAFDDQAYVTSMAGFLNRIGLHR